MCVHVCMFFVLFVCTCCVGGMGAWVFGWAWGVGGWGGCVHVCM